MRLQRSVRLRGEDSRSLNGSLRKIRLRKELFAVGKVVSDYKWGVRSLGRPRPRQKATLETCQEKFTKVLWFDLLKPTTFLSDSGTSPTTGGEGSFRSLDEVQLRGRAVIKLVSEPDYIVK